MSFAKDNVAVFAQSSTTVADTSWHHLVVTKSKATRKLYIDGVDHTSLLTNQTLINTTSALFLGAKNGAAQIPWGDDRRVRGLQPGAIARHGVRPLIVDV